MDEELKVIKHRVANRNARLTPVKLASRVSKNLVGASCVIDSLLVRPRLQSRSVAVVVRIDCGCPCGRAETRDICRIVSESTKRENGPQRQFGAMERVRSSMKTQLSIERYLCFNPSNQLFQCVKTAYFSIAKTSMTGRTVMTACRTFLCIDKIDAQNICV